MELQCVESLGPESLPSPSMWLHESHAVDKSLLSSVSRLNSPRPDLPKTHCPQQQRPLLPFARSSSPLTQSPPPSPKRRRIIYPDHVPNPPPSRPRPLPHSSPHPLATLASRDVKYVLDTPDHLADTPVLPTMRQEVVSWCADMTADLDLPDAITAIAVNLFDRFLARQPVPKNVLYALSASCLLLACKIVLDQDVPHEEISSRARVPINDIHVMETVILSVLEWAVNVVTPHEVVNELNAEMQETGFKERVLEVQESLMLNALLDYRLAACRATSVGVACYILSISVAKGEAYADHKASSVYELARRYGVCLDQVDLCVDRLRASLCSLFGDFEVVDSEEEDEELF